MNGNESTSEILMNARYLMKGENWTDLTKRVSNAIAEAEKTPELKKEWAKKFADIIQKKEFVPASPFMMNAGQKNEGMNNHLFSCYVLPVEDSLEQIYKTIADAAKIFQVAGGVGYDFSTLRPKGCSTSTSGGTSSGPLSFMRVFNASCNELKAGGRRKGAQMGVFRCDHPDIEEFINVKQDLTQLTNFNLSVAITNDFMQAVHDDEMIQLYFEGRSDKDHVVRAKSLWDQIVKSAWRCGEPGVLFIDRINDEDPIGGISCTNPCGEIPLPPYGCCNLGSINLGNLIRRGKFAWDLYKDIIRVAIHFLDNAIDVNNYTLPEIEEQQLNQRRIGLGVMGLADMFVKLGIAYDSKEAREMSKELARILHETTKTASEDIAKKKGAFPAQNHSKFKDDAPIRNVTRTAIAPTGSISIVAECSSGIEPIYAITVERRHDLADHDVIVEINPLFLEMAKKQHFYSEALIAGIRENNGSCQGVEGIPDNIQSIFKIAADIKPEDHVEQLAAWQENIDSAVSKTINLASSATEEDIERIFSMAFDRGCKGITVYRDGCRGAQVLSSGVQKKERPDVVPGKTIRVPTSLGTMYINVGIIDGRPFETFVHLSSGGTNAAADAEGLGKMVSLALRTKTSVYDIVKQLKGIGSGAAVFHKGRVITSIPDAIAFALEKYFLDSKVAHPDDHAKFASGHTGSYCKDCDN